MSNLILLTIPLTSVISWILALQSEKDFVTSFMERLATELSDKGYEVEDLTENSESIHINEFAGSITLSFSIYDHTFKVTRYTYGAHTKKIVKLEAVLEIDYRQKQKMIKYKIIDQLLNSNPHMRVPRLSREIFSSLQPEMRSEQLVSTYLQFLNENQIDNTQRIVLYPRAKVKEIIRVVNELTQLADTINHLNFVTEDYVEQDHQSYGLMCVICKQSILVDQMGKYDLIMQLLCCNYFVHKSHLSGWLQAKNSCPSCYRNNPRWMRINLI